MLGILLHDDRTWKVLHARRFLYQVWKDLMREIVQSIDFKKYFFFREGRKNEEVEYISSHLKFPRMNPSHSRILYYVPFARNPLF